MARLIDQRMRVALITLIAVLGLLAIQDQAPARTAPMKPEASGTCVVAIDSGVPPPGRSRC